jgi:hypothetical protein
MPKFRPLIFVILASMALSACIVIETDHRHPTQVIQTPPR